MNCIICNNEANATGSHIVPASLIQNCVGKHYKEESYEIDAKNADIDVYFGRDNLKNISTEIKENHYKRDHLLCQICEDNLGKIESNFSTNFLQKFREDRFSQNFKVIQDEFGVEILTPLKYDKEEFYAYLYSIIYRFCMVNGLEEEEYFLNDSDLNKLKLYLNEYLYGDKLKSKEYIKEFNLIINFDRLNTDGSFIASANQFKNPYIFYFCDPILLLFIGKIDTKAKMLYGLYINNINNDENLKILISSDFYATYKDIMSKYSADTFMTNAITNICKMNQKSYEENLIEFNIEMQKLDSTDNEKALKAYEILYKKYQ